MQKNRVGWAPRVNSYSLLAGGFCVSYCGHVTNQHRAGGSEVWTDKAGPSREATPRQVSSSAPLGQDAGQTRGEEVVESTQEADCLLFPLTAPLALADP